MSDRYLVPAVSVVPENDLRLSAACLHRVETEIKRSRFIASLGRAGDKIQARLFVDCVKREFTDATHNCWAYAAGRPGDTADIGQSDDGEPRGTAGRPMLNQILCGAVGELVCVVTRYFGGVKLGVGGLMRAYQGCVATALESLPVTEKVSLIRLSIRLNYCWVNSLYHLLERFQAVCLAKDFTETSIFSIELPQDQAKTFTVALREATDGQAAILPDISPDISVEAMR